MAFTNSSVLILDDTATVHSFQTGQDSPVAVSIPAGSTGTWTWVVSRAGHSTQLGTFDTTGGGFDTASPTPTQRLQPSGTPMFTGTIDPNIQIVFDLQPGNQRCFIDIADASVSAQAVLDAVETALETQEGCEFLAVTSGSEIGLASLSAGNFLFMGTGYRFRRAAVGDVNATVGAFALSVDGAPTDGVNGSVSFLSASLTADEIATAVWDSLRTAHIVDGSMGQAQSRTLSQASLAAALSA